MCTSWQPFLMVLICFMLLMSVVVVIVMYLDGYWSPKQRQARWERHSFVGQDYARRGRNKSGI